LLAALLWVAGDRHVMCGQTRSRLTRTVVIRDDADNVRRGDRNVRPLSFASIEATRQ
jgi:hypothetical protein